MNDPTDESRARRTVVGVGVLVATVAAVVGAFALARVRAPAHERATPTHRAPPAAPVFRTKVERGAYVFALHGCSSCHGDRGRGGVRNANYVLGTVPALDEIADKMGLDAKSDADAFTHLVEAGENLDAPSSPPPIDDYPRVLAQYHAIRSVIENGATAAKLDPNGPPPPLSMPAWKNILSASDIDAVVVYLVSLMPWDGAP